MHWIILGAGTMTSVPSTRLSLESLSALSCNPSNFSVQLPFFDNTTNTIDRNQSSRSHTGSNSISSINPNSNNLSYTPAIRSINCYPLYYSFFLSPTTSTSSLVSVDSTSDKSSGASRDTQSTTAMPGPTLAAPEDGSLGLMTPNYFSHSTSTFTTADGTHHISQWRPESAPNASSARSTSPIFSRWARRNQHHHMQSQQDMDVSSRGSTESKIRTSPKTLKRTTRSRSSSVQKRHSQAGMVPQMTQEEFESLPLAIQRKYFSTLERLRFARDSGLVDGISQHYDAISSHNFKRRKPRQDRSASDNFASRARRRSLLESRVPPPEPSPSYASLPDKIKRKDYTREEQVVLARRLRASVILDAADEAIYKLNRRASTKQAPGIEVWSPSLSSRRNSMDSHGSIRRPPSQADNSKDVPQSFYESFRWLDEEEDLDLRLFLDDYHANLRGDLPSQSKQQRPSFRRHLSISKIPFGRNSISTSRPGTSKETTSPTSPTHSPSGSASNPFGHTRRKSRALSLITPKHTPQDSITAFDPAAAHYQDPEARLKLRVYLASPQKFDEAIEFGFPSTDVLSTAPVVGKEGGTQHHRRQSKKKMSDGSSKMRTFLADGDDDEDDDDDADRLSLNSDQVSMADPDSPKTPQTFEHRSGAIRPLRAVSTEPIHLGTSASEGVGGYAQVPASSREMTLRMTLTRPDLRAHEDQIYGWQQQRQQAGRRSTTTAPLSSIEPNVVHHSGASRKESMDKVFAGIDHENATNPERGVMKRIWNRVRRA
ncbi:hypothetical protein QBC46DRAFT_270373 [Diplogelasinospora grovesii]|uniref:Mucin n=1 Tax=Diplogelasinospora grovesii TaxID=303347 RepID=A0AAN6N0G0_9PEZI|nr:hypothetical protein QBC46DRAFT_270373 [Diplogelasinospora grovesii]